MKESKYLKEVSYFKEDRSQPLLLCKSEASLGYKDPVAKQNIQTKSPKNAKCGALPALKRIITSSKAKGLVDSDLKTLKPRAKINLFFVKGCYIRYS